LRTTLLPKAIESNDKWLTTIVFSMLGIKEDAIKSVMVRLFKVH
jgi:hypothetical protein